MFLWNYRKNVEKILPNHCKRILTYFKTIEKSLQHNNKIIENLYLYFVFIFTIIIILLRL